MEKMIGAIFGDILGSTYEFGVKDKEIYLIHDEDHFTDDSVLTFALAEWTIEYGKVSLGNGEHKYLLAKKFYEFTEKYPDKAYGLMYIDWICKYEDTEKIPMPNNSYGNGAAMRVSPVAYVFDEIENGGEIRKIASRDTVRISDAKCWLIHLQQVEKKSYSSIHSIRGVLRPAFQLAVDDDLIRKNSFQFQLMEVVVNDSVTREAISRAEERKFLRFVKEDPHFCRYYEGIYILFKTGLRISEFCGLTISDIDFKEHTINIDHQLQKKSKIGYYIQETKTTSGTRKIPMTADVEECFRKIIEKRNPPKAEPMVDGKSGFLYFDKNESICYSLHWEHYFQHIIQKYNNTYKVQMPVITPHVCRHTYCSNMAKSGMNPKALQYLMGHSDISVTLNTYTHVNLEDAREEVARIQVV